MCVSVRTRVQDLSEACHLALQCLKGALLEHKRISGGLGLPLSLSADHMISFSHMTLRCKYGVRLGHHESTECAHCAEIKSQ